MNSLKLEMKGELMTTFMLTLSARSTLRRLGLSSNEVFTTKILFKFPWRDS